MAKIRLILPGTVQGTRYGTVNPFITEEEYDDVVSTASTWFCTRHLV